MANSIKGLYRELFDSIENDKAKSRIDKLYSILSVHETKVNSTLSLQRARLWSRKFKK